MIVVKVGGSLFDHPQLVPGLRGYLDSLAPSELLLVPGGGKVVDAVRELDRVHGLGEDLSHGLAVWALGVTAEFLIHTVARGPRVTVLDCYQFTVDDEARPGALPHSWDVTSDSIAARAAIVFGVERLILLKSVDVPLGTPWGVAADRGWVDAHFPRAIATADFPIDVINFRQVLDLGSS